MQILTHKLSGILILIIMLATSFEMFAQPGQGRGMQRGRGMRDADMQKKIREVKKIKLLEILNMDEETSDKFMAKYSFYDKKIAAEKNKIDKVSIKLQDAIDNKSSEKVLSERIKAMEDIRSNLYSLHKEMSAEMKTILSTEQYAKFIVFEHRFMKRLFKMMNNRR
ncbi:MAG: hypothetical protein KAH48_09705, partial [Chlorobi bacterium]|nr:hypothetical protein [Chlorobiota bacterium]